MFTYRLIKDMREAIPILLLASCIVLGLSTVASAQVIRIEGHGTDKRIHVSKDGKLRASPLADTARNGQWTIEQVANSKYVRIKNLENGTYIHNEDGSLNVGAVEDGWWSAMWELGGPNPHTIKNRWKSTYLALSAQGISLGAGPTTLWQFSSAASKSVGSPQPMTPFVQAPVGPGKQCIWNKSGFVLKAEWYAPGTLVDYDAINKKYVLNNSTSKQVDVFPTAQGRCINGSGHTVVLYAEGGDIANVAVVTGVGAAASAAAAAACAATAGGGCAPAAAAAVAATATVASGLIAIAATRFGLPEGAFKVMVPDNKRYVDVWGTVWSPQANNLGGPVN